LKLEYAEPISNFAFNFNLRRCTMVAVALLDGGANIDFVSPPRVGFQCAGMTPLMCAAKGNHAGVTMLLLERGADGTKTTTRAAYGHPAGFTAFDIVRRDATCLWDNETSVATFAVLRLKCCSTCGMTSAGLPATAAGGEPRRLKHCARCPASAIRAHYCGPECQRADWVSRHRAECAEARRAQLPAGVD
jgi:hypothetical protein